LQPRNEQSDTPDDDLTFRSADVVAQSRELIAQADAILERDR
jgi:hypothetical protein